MGDKSPPKEQPKQRTGKGFTYEVVLLDGEHVNFELDKNADGRELLEKVCQHLDLQEKDYFGLQYVDERLPHHLKCWLSPEKKISKQKKRGPWLFDFALKFYPPDPTQLRESLTRWLVTLQVRRDILSGKLPATFLTQAMLGSYCVQADVGDYDPNEHHGIEYVKDIPFSPNQTTELLEKIVELHKQHKGQTPDEAEQNFLENAKKLSMYGVDLHQAEDANNVELMLGVCASGLQVYREKLRISRFVWPKILKISYKRRHFYIKVRPSDNAPQENTVSFRLKSHRLAKRLWKICVEHHAFFRLREAEQNQNSAMFPRLGSKFRYSGRTLYQARHTSQILDRPDPYFERSQPARSTYAAPTNRSRSVDELSNRPGWNDDIDVEKRRPSESGREGRDKRDHMGQPTPLSQIGLPAGMKPVENETGNELEPGSDGKDRQDRKRGEDDATETNRRPGDDTMGLTPAELQKKAKEDEKERKKREKEEEKRRKKEEEERKKAEKLAKKGKGKVLDPTAEDRRDHMGGGDNTERLPGRTSGTYGDQEGGYGGPGYGGPGSVPGMGLGAGDMSMAGVGGEEKWIDNKMRFEPIVPAKKETKDSLTSGEDGIDHTMPFFSPAATSTFGRPGKVPPPVPPKHNSYVGDDSFSRTDVYKTEKDGIQETRVEHKVVLSSTDDDFDYDAALAEAIRSVTEFNPDMSVERIECVQQIEDVKDK
ncbi:hypothetical protein V1264_022779 [Littorina saxatilis]|uniref:FERM domain-containing protein n=1 Tax=Littorina saxatilis TaxID=31220 RepID=A0AAN9B882_9CAEN